MTDAHTELRLQDFFRQKEIVQKALLWKVRTSLEYRGDRPVSPTQLMEMAARLLANNDPGVMVIVEQYTDWLRMRYNRNAAGQIHTSR